jgi:ABC-2 type transport system permease protein
MRNILAIFLKELRITFTTPIAYISLTVFTLVSSFFFSQMLRGFQRRIAWAAQMRPRDLEYLNLTDSVIQPLFFNVAVIFIFVIPFLTMRLIAEERRSGTFELLQTCPVTPLQIVMGKYLSGLLVVMIMVLLVGLYPLLVGAYSVGGGPEWSTVATGLLGLFLAGAAFTSIGLFVSSLTRSQIVAAAVTFCALLLLWMAGWAASDNVGAVREVLAAVSAIERIRAFTKGAIDLRDLVYYLSLAGLGVFLTRQVLEARRWR